MIDKIFFFIILITIGLIFLISSLLLSKRNRIIKEKNKIVDGKISYSDLNVPGASLFSNKYMIAGKPDYIVKKNNRFIPVEYKSGNHKNPMNNHVFQLAAYCHLVEENYGCFVPYGMLVYNNSNSFKIPFDPNIRFKLENTINMMRKDLNKKKLVRNHNDPSRCKNCSMRKNCNERLC